MAKDLRTYLSNRRTRLPKPIPAEEAARRLEQLHEDHAGATFSLYFGDMSGQEFFAFSLYPEPNSALAISGRAAGVGVLRAFIESNRALLSDPRLCVGTWYQEAEDITFIDVVAVLPDREAAWALGRRYNQIAIFDLGAGEEIETGGTGEWVLIDIPPEQRLPKLER